MADANIRAVITAKDEASSVLKTLSNNISEVGGGAAKFLGGVLTAAAAAGTVALGALSAVAIDTVNSFNKSQAVQAQLNAVLKSTNDVSGLTVQALNEQSAALQRLTKYSDEQIGSVQALLLTFTDISGPTVKQATSQILDVSTALHEDLQSAAIQVGKALQDPVLGITALRRVGVQFSEDQRKVIDQLVATGQKAKAQQIILAELNKEFGGSAKAAGATFAGSMTIIKNNIDDVKEKMGQAIVSGITPLAEKLAKFVTSDTFAKWAENVANTILAIIKGLSDFASAVIVKFEAIKTYLEKNNAFQEWLKITNKLIQDIQNTIENNLLPAIRHMNSAFGPEAREALKLLAGAAGVVLLGVLNAINSILTQIGFVINAVASLKDEFNKLGNNSIFKSVTNAIAPGSNLLSSLTHRASGGPVTAGQPYIVGEHRPELFIPSQSGTIIPQVGGRASTVNITVQAGAFMGNPSDARKYAQLIANSLKDVAGMKNQTAAQMLGGM